MELLAPAGNWAALQAAFANGADAVYLGGRHFNARQSAANFSLTEIEKAVEYAHLRDKKIYLTFNTLIDNREFPAALDYAYSLYRSGADALIIQDLGLLTSLHELLPDLPLHASTQMTVHNDQAALLLQKQGVARIVLAREMSLEEINRIHQETPGMEFEVFVHGALCFCYSGQCLFSSMVGGRSGNRGRCAQPCRLPYQLMADNGAEKKPVEARGRYLLSPADLCLVDHLAELKKAGVNSLKIEGRMKRPEYVAVVTSAYRHALDLLRSNPEARVDETRRKKLYQIFNRTLGTGFLAPGQKALSINRPNNRGVYLGRVISHYSGYITIKLSDTLALGDGLEVWVAQGKGPSAIVKAIDLDGQAVVQAVRGQVVTVPMPGRAAPGDRVFKTHDQALIAEAQASLQADQAFKIPVKMMIRIKAGSPLQLTLDDSAGRSVRVEGSTIAVPAQGQPLEEEVILEKLSRLGGTPFVLDEYRLEYEGNLILPYSDLNESRRRAAEQLLALITHRPAPDAEDQARFQQGVKERLGPKSVRRRIAPPLLSIAVGTVEAARQGIEAGADRVYIAIEGWRGYTAKREEIAALSRWGSQRGAEVIPALPRIQKAGEMQPWQEIKPAAFPALLVGNLGALSWAMQNGIPCRTDYSLNCFNQFSLDWLLSRGVQGACLSPELNLEQLHNFRDLSAAELMVHGDLTLMVSESCPIEAAKGGEKCGSACQKARYWLRDEKGYEFPVATDKKCRFYVFNSRRLCLLDDLERLWPLGCESLRIEAWCDSPAQTAEAAAVYRRAINELSQGKKPDLALLRKVLQQKQGFKPTKGHLYRGVL